MECASLLMPMLCFSFKYFPFLVLCLRILPHPKARQLSLLPAIGLLATSLALSDHWTKHQDLKGAPLIFFCMLITQRFYEGVLTSLANKSSFHSSQQWVQVFGAGEAQMPRERAYMCAFQMQGQYPGLPRTPTTTTFKLCCHRSQLGFMWRGGGR